MTEKAAEVGKDIADKAKKAKVNSVVFDRSSKQYHGRVKALAVVLVTPRRSCGGRDGADFL